MISPHALRKNIILTGFMGTGKSAVGRILADRLGFTFVDTDSLIEKRTGITIREIFESEGEERFREIESAVISEVCSGKGQVISTGGGAITVEKNLMTMRMTGHIVCLTATVDDIYGRVEREGHRPLLNTKDQKKSIRELFESRRHHYLKADVTVDTTGKRPESVADEVLVCLGVKSEM